jgi:hypothetical protein
MLAIAHLMMTTGVFGLPNVAFPSPGPPVEASHPQVTAAPSPHLLDLRFQRRADGLQCASSCVTSAVTKSTDCRADDYACGCLPSNAMKIAYGAEPCIINTCGYAVYVSKAMMDPLYTPLKRDAKNMQPPLPSCRTSARRLLVEERRPRCRP